MNPALTEVQNEVLEYIKHFISTEGYPPTRNDIRLAFCWSSPNAAEEHLRALARKHVIQLVPAVSRGIKVL